MSKCFLQCGTARNGDTYRRHPSLPLTETLTPTLADGGTLPLLTKFTRVRLSELTGWIQRGDDPTAERSKMLTQWGEIEDEESSSDRRGSWSNVPRRFGLCSNSSSIKLRKPSSEDMRKYRSKIFCMQPSALDLRILYSRDKKDCLQYFTAITK